MDGLKMAHIRRCHACEYRREAHANFWRWPRCTADGTEKLELDNEFMQGGACPLGRWDGLGPVDLDAERAARIAKQEERERAGIGRVIASLVAGLPEEEKGARLTVAVEQNVIMPAVAAEIMEGKVEPFVATTL
ncbi:MAG TPA: hypothetical protein VM389_10870 [Phycisphaerae bacterium]|nr:hypothetical protein [Phycisphaerae bacterium]